MFDDSYYAEFYHSKLIQDLTSSIAENESALKINTRIINEYPDLLKQWEIDYKKFVTDPETEYADGCTTIIKYTDCADLAVTIQKNKIITAKNKEITQNDYSEAFRFNSVIENDLRAQRSSLAELNSTSTDSLNSNIGEYSIGVAFGNESIYLRSFKDNPISGETIRVMIHEFLHAYSFHQNKELPAAFDEGMTDYLTTKALTYNEFDSIRVSGYPLEMQVILALLEKIPYESLVRVYFTKDEVLLKKLITQHFPETSYAILMKKYNEIFESTFHVNGNIMLRHELMIH